METQGSQPTPGGGTVTSTQHAVITEAGVLPGWAVEYFKVNPLSVAWQSMLAIGGVILALHFVHIGFFPDMDWQSSLALVAIVALTGLLVWCFVCLMLVFPAFTWSVVLEELEKKPDSSPEPGGDKPGETRAVSDTSAPEQRSPSRLRRLTLLALRLLRRILALRLLRGLVGYRNEPDSTKGAGETPKEPAVRSLVLLFGLPTFALWATLVLIAAADFRTIYESEWLLTSVVVTVPLVSSLATYWRAGGRDALGPRFKKMVYWRYFLAALVGCVVSVSPVALTHTLAYSRFSHTPSKAVVFIVGAALAVLFNLAVFRRWLAGSARRTSLGMLPQAVLLGTFGVASLIAMTGNWVLIPEGVAYLYGIGNLEGTTLVLDREGCGVASEAGLGPELDAGGEWCRLPGVKILNRLGTTYYVRSPRGDHFTLPSSSVKSYELPPPAVAAVHLKLTVEGAFYKSVAVTVTNLYKEPLTNVIADVEFRDGAGKLTQSRRLTLGELPAKEEWRGDATPVPGTGADLSCKVVLTRYGRRLPYELK